MTGRKVAPAQRSNPKNLDGRHQATDLSLMDLEQLDWNILDRLRAKFLAGTAAGDPYGGARLIWQPMTN